ncbi:thiamine pyrophosphate-binding protein [Microbacterium sp. ET2]|uniref:alpha-keto acid decarboxylase family protein n=1 Tax=Microbacterium albipurpureum TaxID=3050384 RepID=UPI00259CC7E7|nr:thiamine pyrophosphate-binding protein [Microbacterium sp. ET2 (Ac-2212)]WJL96591.1 thiamine pyrophosphate-binding protein [Microbacterium sp. ET2 (Ac-2212)]
MALHAGTTPGGVYTVGDYLLDRLADAGVRHLFGVPGDFTLSFLDHVQAHPAIEWVGCANELGAGYAADGYARLHGLGALCTTFGVGELSAIAALAGSRAEHVPVVHVVGAPTTATQAAGRATHHTLGDGDFGHFARMTAEIAAAHATVTAGGYADEIDGVLMEARDRRLPGYLVLPADVAAAPATPPVAPLAEHPGVTDAGVAADFRARLTERMTQASTVALLADILVSRLGAEQHLHRVTALGVPHATLLWGRRVVDESAPGYLGSYLGASSDEHVRIAVEDADLLVMAGVQFTDLTSGFFSQRIDSARAVEIGGEAVSWDGRIFSPLAMTDALDIVAEVLTKAGVGGSPMASAAPGQSTETASNDIDSLLGQEALWREVADFLSPGDIVFADQGTSFYGMADHRLPGGVTFVGQPLWASIGYTLPAVLGAALAAPDRRPVLLIGDGAAQMTVAELGTLLRRGIPAVVIVVDNAGYTVERVIHGANEAYNDIGTWDWVQLMKAMDAAGSARGIRVDTPDALRAALAEARDGATLTLIQAVVPPQDVPPVLRTIATAAAAANRAPA